MRLFSRFYLVTAFFIISISLVQIIQSDSLDRYIVQTSAQNDETDNSLSDVDKQKRNELRVLLASPQGKIGRGLARKEISVLFDRPMVPLKVLAKKVTGAFKIYPPVPGKFRWYGSKVCAFIPEQEWKPETVYRIVVPKGTRSLDGKILGSDYSFSFIYQLKALYIKRVYPNSKRRINYSPSFDVIFSHEVDLAKIKDFIELRAGGRKINIDLGYPYQKRKNRVRIQVKELLPRDRSVELIFLPGLPSSSYPSRLKSKTRYSFKTYGPLEVFISKKPKYFQNKWSYYLQFSSPVDIKKVAPFIQFSPKAKLLYSPRGQRSRIYFYQWNLRAGQKYKLTIGDIEDIYGNKISGQKDFNVEMADYRSHFYAPGNEVILESQMKARLPIQMVNYPKIDIKVGSFDIKQVQEKLLNYRMRMDHLISLREDSWSPGAKKNQPATVLFDLQQYMQKRAGWYYVEFKPHASKTSSPYDNRTRGSLVQVTDLGLSVKEAFDQVHIWTYSLNSTKAFANVTVSAYDGKKLQGSCVTNGEGYCTIQKTWQSYSKYALYHAFTKDDQAYVSLRRHRIYTHYSYYGNAKTVRQGQLRGSIYYDRKLYRPGEKMRFKAVLALVKKGKLVPYANRKARLKIFNSQGKKQFEEMLLSSSEGGLWSEWQIPKDASLGHYRISFKAIGLNQYVQDSFQVEEFRPATFQVALNAGEKGIISQDLSIKVRGDYLFGAPMSGREVNWHVYRSKKRNSYSGSSEYGIGDQVYDYWFYESRKDRSSLHKNSRDGYFSGGRGKLDKEGKFKTKIYLKPYLNWLELKKKNQEKKILKLSFPYNLRIAATVKNLDKKSVTKTLHVPVSHKSFDIGIRNLDPYHSKEREFLFDVKTEVKNFSSRNLTESKNERNSVDLYVIHPEWKSIRIKGLSSSMRWENRRILNLVSQKKLKINKKAQRIRLKVEKAGQYWLILHDPISGNFSRVSFYAFGGDYFTGRSNDDSVTILLDRDHYRPGETAKILLQSPFSEGKAIITLEREKVFYRKVINWKQRNQLIKIPVKKEYFPNFYFSVQFLRGRVDAPAGFTREQKNAFYREDQGKPKFRFGLRKISVQDPEYNLPLEIATDKKSYYPGSMVKISIQSRPNAEVLLAVADRGVLDLIDYKFANPNDTMYKNWPLLIRSLENRRFIIDQVFQMHKGDSPGGGGGMEDGRKLGGFQAKNEDGSRKDFRYTAYWNPTIRTDKSGKAAISFRLPDNLTTFRISAVAASKSRYNLRLDEIKVKKELMLQAVVPRFLRPGDKIKAGAILHNFTGSDGRFRLRWRSKDLDEISPVKEQDAVQILSLANGESREILFPLEITSNIYREMLKQKKKAIRATVEVQSLKSNERIFRDSIPVDIPVLEYKSQEAFALSGYTKKEEKEFIAFPEQKDFDGQARLEFRLAPTALLGLDKGFRFFQSNPYFCLEQRASAFLLAMSSGKLLKHYQFAPPQKKAYDFRQIRELFLGQIGVFQNQDGGFRLWKDQKNSRSNPYLSSYIVRVLFYAKKGGYSVPELVYKRAIQYLNSYVHRKKKYYHAETLASIFYVFSKSGIYDHYLENYLRSRYAELSLRALTLYLDGLSSWKDKRDHSFETKIYKKIISSLQFTTNKVTLLEARQRPYYFYTRGSALAAILQLMMAKDPKNPILEKMVRYMISEKSKLWLDSHSSGTMAVALYEYFQRYDKFQGKMTAKIQIGNKLFQECAFQNNELTLQKYNLQDERFAEFAQGKLTPLIFNKDNDQGRLYYSARLIYYPLILKDKARDEGLEIQRDIRPLELFAKSEKSNKDRNGISIGGYSGSQVSLKRGDLYLVRIRVVSTKPHFNFLLIDPLPSHSEIVNFNFQTENKSLFVNSRSQISSSFSPYFYSSRRTEYRDDSFVLTEDYLYPGFHEYSYVIRPVLNGQSQYPPASASLMYEPEIFGRTAAETVRVKE